MAGHPSSGKWVEFNCWNCAMGCKSESMQATGSSVDNTQRVARSRSGLHRCPATLMWIVQRSVTTHNMSMMYQFNRSRRTCTYGAGGLALHAFAQDRGKRGTSNMNDIVLCVATRGVQALTAGTAKRPIAGQAGAPSSIATKVNCYGV
eukprot:848714-Amphidinium_carterae.1